MSDLEIIEQDLIRVLENQSAIMSYLLEMAYPTRADTKTHVFNELLKLSMQTLGYVTTRRSLETGR